jgi:NADPH:quinone reductase-like Zn-dependent oxidoreductase
MKAVQFERYGAPDVLRLSEVEEPAAQRDRVLIKVRATSVNQHDVLVRSGRLKIVTGSRFPFGTGVDFAGEVITDHTESPIHGPGDFVWGTIAGLARRIAGSASEYVSVPPEQISRMPQGMSFTDAASMVAGGTAAMTALRDQVHVREGERVLIRGGLGAVGNAAIQYAHGLGAHVTTLVRSHSVELARELGADVVTSELSDGSSGEKFDVIVDTVGTDLRALRGRLGNSGRMVTVAFSSVGAISYIALSAVHGDRRVRAFLGAPKSPLLRDLATLATAGSIKPLVGAIYPLGDIAQAHRAVEARAMIGKHVISVN